MFSLLFSQPRRDQVIALAGIFQACAIVDSYARLGAANSKDVETAIYSLLQQDPESTESVYRSVESLEHGFDTMTKVLDNPKDPNNAAILRYVVGVLYIARKISASKPMLDKIGRGIANAARQSEHFSVTHENVIANIADLYQNTISTLKFRIQVQGVADHLQQATVASRIRCLLFSAIRSAFLWQQLKGSRFHLMFQRHKLVEIAKDLRREAAARNRIG